MSKFVQIAVALNSDEECLYALTDDGKIFQRRWAARPRKIERVNSKSIEFVDGWTEGWIEVSDCASVPVRHPEAPAGESDE